MVSMSPRWLSEKLCADAEDGALTLKRASASSAGASRRNEGIGISSGDGFPGQAVSRYSKNLRQVGLFQLLFWPGNGFAVTISSALTHPGVPIAKRVFAREARSRAVLLSPRRKAACAEARSACAKSPLRP